MNICSINLRNFNGPKRKMAWISFCLVFLSFSCQQKKKETDFDKEKSSIQSSAHHDLRAFHVPIQFAINFRIDYFKNYKLISLLNPNQKNDTLQKYILSEDTSALGHMRNQGTFVQIPVKSAICLSSLYAAYMEKLNLLENLIAVDDHRYINSLAILQHIKKNKLMDVGDISKVNVEKILLLHPDLIFTYLPPKGISQLEEIFKNKSIFAYTLDQDEASPLGRAEWILFVAAFFNQEKQASIFFNEMAQRYMLLKKQIQANSLHPSVFTGIKYGDTWYMPAGNSYLANLIADAGGNYIWKKDGHTGSLNLNWEEVYQKASQADFWIHVSSFSTLHEVESADPRYANFKAFKMKNIFNNIARVNADGGNDYWEAGMLNPDLLLADLINIFHPELKENHRLLYYKKIQ